MHHACKVTSLVHVRSGYIILEVARHYSLQMNQKRKKHAVNVFSFISSGASSASCYQGHNGLQMEKLRKMVLYVRLIQITQLYHFSNFAHSVVSL